MRWVFRLLIMGLACLCASPCISQTSSQDQTYYRYEVWGTSTLHSDRQRPWSESYDTESEARERQKEIERDHSKGGILEASPDHPKDLYIKKVPYKDKKRSAKEDEKPKNDEPLKGPSGGMPKAQSKGIITVKVYNLVNNKWIEQPNRKYETPTDYDKALDYYQRVRGTAGWTATWNAPGWPKPAESKPAPSYVPPVVGSTEAKRIMPYEATSTGNTKTASNNTADPMIGSWSLEKGGEFGAYCVFKFRSDGTVTSQDFERSSGWQGQVYNLRWKRENGRLYVTNIRGNIWSDWTSEMSKARRQ